MVPFVLVVLEVPDIPKVSVGPVILAVPVVLMTLVVPVVLMTLVVPVVLMTLVVPVVLVAQVTFVPAAVLSIGEVLVLLPVLRVLTDGLVLLVNRAELPLVGS